MDAKFRKKALVSAGTYMAVALATIFFPALVGEGQITSWYLLRLSDYFTWSRSIYHADWIVMLGLAVFAVRFHRKLLHDESLWVNAHFHSVRQTYHEMKVRREAEILKAVREYSIRTLGPYLSQHDIHVLIYNIQQWHNDRNGELPSVTLLGHLTSVDLRHYGWNIGERLGWTGQEKALFLKQTFAEELKGQEVDTIRRTFRQGGKGRIPLDVPQNGDFSFHSVPLP